MAENLQKLNERLRRAKKKAKKKSAKKQVAKPDAMDRLVSAIERIQQPQVIVEARKPTSYRVIVDINTRGDMVGAILEPIK